MVIIKPFRAIRYTEKAGKHEDLVTQPYDKIDQSLQKGYYRKSKYNYCRLVLPIEETKYEKALLYLAKQDSQHAIYWLNEAIFGFQNLGLKEKANLIEKKLNMIQDSSQAKVDTKIFEEVIYDQG